MRGISLRVNKAHLQANNSQTFEQLREHYEVEKELATRLRTASREERRRLYPALYDELCRRLPHHPQLTREADPERVAGQTAFQMQFLRRFLRPGATFLEVGPGDCALSFEVAKTAKHVYAIDVSEEITKRATLPPVNFELMIADGSSIPLPAGSVDIAYSTSVMEHIHPDDALEQLKNIHRALAPGGIYVCLTCNRLNGPHDVSKYFDPVPTGFHLREYTITELVALFKQVGFSKTVAYIGGRGLFLKAPLWLVRLYEGFLDRLPYAIRKPLANTVPFRALLSIRLIGTK